MQKVITLRASQKDLEEATAKFVSLGWRIVCITRGSEWGRVGSSYRWTITLEIDNCTADADKIIRETQEEFSRKSGAKAIGCVFGIIGAFFLLCIIMLSQV